MTTRARDGYTAGMKVRLVEMLPALLMAGLLVAAGSAPQQAAEPSYTMTVTPSR